MQETTGKQALQDCPEATRRVLRNGDAETRYVERLGEVDPLLAQRDTVAKGALPRSSVHRLLTGHDLSRIPDSAGESEEDRAYEAGSAGDFGTATSCMVPRFR